MRRLPGPPRWDRFAQKTWRDFVRYVALAACVGIAVSLTAELLVGGYEDEAKLFFRDSSAVGIYQGDEDGQVDSRLRWTNFEREELRRNHGVPAVFLEKMRPDMVRRLFNLCVTRATDGERPQILFADVRNGLGNRIRALSSAISFAEDNDMILVVVWEETIHLQAKFHELFVDLNTVVFVEELPELWPLAYSRFLAEKDLWHNIDVYNYMHVEQESEKGKLITYKPGRNIYFRGCEMMNIGNLDEMREKARRAIHQLRPVPQVQKLVDRLEEQYGALSQKVGVHIRGLSVQQEFTGDFDAELEYGSDSLSKMEYWRQRSSYEAFSNEMKRKIKRSPRIKFFVATDAPEDIKRLTLQFPGRISHLPQLQLGSCAGRRDLECSRMALADLLALARTKQVLGSNYSSFSSVVALLSARAFRRAGIEFAA